MTWTWWMTLAVIAGVLVLIGCIPVGVDARYQPGGVSLSIKLWFFRLRLFLRKAKNKKPQKKRTEKKTAKQTDAEAPAGANLKELLLSGGAEGLFQLLSLLGEILGDLRRKLRVDVLTLHVVVGGADDPAKAAISYGRAWAAVGTLTPMFERFFVIKKRDIQPVLDYNKTGTQVEAQLVTSITIGRALALALRAGLGFLKFIHQRKKAV